jgi:glycolate oxidase FAD binding subunit
MARDRDDSLRLVAAVGEALAADTPLAICGRGSKTFLAPESDGAMLAIGDHSGVIDYRHDELVVTARSGTPLVELRRVLAAQGQMMAFDPPTFAGDGTLGGAVATGLSGPGRPWYGALRDAVLGVTIINGLGQRLRFGGSVMKNVAGYDVSRLMVGAYGTLGVLLDVSVKVLPLPQAETTRSFEFDRDSALARVVAWARTPLPLSATCHVDGRLHVRLSGTEKGVRAAAAQIGGDEVPYAAEFWDSLRDRTHRYFDGAHPLRVALPSATAYPDVAGDWLTEWGGAQRWLNSAAAVADVDAAARRLGGSARAFGGAYGHQLFDEGALKYHRRLKHAFDPHAILNRGRLFAEIGRDERRTA